MSRYRVHTKVRIENSNTAFLFFFKRKSKVTTHYQVVVRDKLTGVTSVIHETTSYLTHQWKIAYYKNFYEHI